MKEENQMPKAKYIREYSHVLCCPHSTQFICTKCQVSCTCHSGNNDCKEHPINNALMCACCEDKMATSDDLCGACCDHLNPFLLNIRKQACEDMIKYMENYKDNYEYADALEAAKEYLKTLR